MLKKIFEKGKGEEGRKEKGEDEGKSYMSPLRHG
jgi:hypothetical protein